MRYLATLITVCFLSCMNIHAQALLPEKVPAMMMGNQMEEMAKEVFSVPYRIVQPEKEPVVLTGHDVVEKAKEYLGVPYRSGQMNPKTGFDCSGFTTYVYQSLNIVLTRTSRSQYKDGTKIENRKDLKKGDLVFFTGSRSSRTIGHVGIVAEVDKEKGTFKFIHAGRKGICITSSTEGYYSKRYVGACRVLS